MRSRPDPMRRVAILQTRPAAVQIAVPTAVRPQPRVADSAATEQAVGAGEQESSPPSAHESNIGRHRRSLTVVGGWVPDFAEPVPAFGRSPEHPPPSGPLPVGGSQDEDSDDDADEADPSDEQTPGIRPRRVGRTWGRFAELWVPEAMRDARMDPGRRGALILLLVAALAAVATAVGVWRDRPEPRPVETTSLAQVGISTIDALPDGSAVDPTEARDTAPAEPTEIVVSVTGLVGNPGVVTLPPGSRVADAVAAAGGANGEADLTGLNLAARLSDGDSVVIGDSAATGAAGSGVSGGSGSGVDAGSNTAGGTAAAGLINLNTADEAALDTLPGVGPVMAQNILAWRAANGKFTSIEQLQEISGIGPSRYAQLSPLVTVS